MAVHNPYVVLNYEMNGNGNVNWNRIVVGIVDDDWMLVVVVVVLPFLDWLDLRVVVMVDLLIRHPIVDVPNYYYVYYYYSSIVATTTVVSVVMANATAIMP